MNFECFFVWIYFPFFDFVTFFMVETTGQVVSGPLARHAGQGLNSPQVLGPVPQLLVPPPGCP